MRIRLTLREMDALCSAAGAMLAGEEGEGDADGVSFDALRDGQRKLSAMRKRRNDALLRRNANEAKRRAPKVSS